MLALCLSRSESAYSTCTEFNRQRKNNRTLLGGKCQVLLLSKRSSVKCLLEVYVCFRIFKTELCIWFFVEESVAS